jgi:hypothetical protein
MKITIARNNRTLAKVDSVAALRTLLVSGHVLPTDLALRSTDSEWSTVDDIVMAARGEPKSSRIFGGIFACILLLVIAAAVGGPIYYFTARISTPREREPRPLELRREAYYAATEFVKGKLGSPSSAKFSVYGVDDQAGADHAGGNQYKAHGFVDAANAFGAAVRTKWNVELERFTDGRWHAKHVVVGSRSTAAR